jgi:hypothetical protein
LKILLCCIKQQINNDDIEMIIDIQAVLNIYVDCLNDFSLYELENDMQLNLNASYKKILLHQESIFVFQSSKLSSLVFKLIIESSFHIYISTWSEYSVSTSWLDSNTWYQSYDSTWYWILDSTHQASKNDVKSLKIKT